MFFEPRHIKEGKHYRHALKKLIHYKEDILPVSELGKLRDLLQKLNAALRTRKREDIGRVQEEIDRETNRIVPPLPDATWRENVEVFLVAIVIAAGVRAFLLQPFKIPTGSMQPTLFGIVGETTVNEPPNLLVRAWEFVRLGRSYFDLTAKADETVEHLDEFTKLNFFTFTEITTNRNRYIVFAPRDTLRRDFRVEEGRSYSQGEPIVRGYVDTGDMVFVDKAWFNFVRPKESDVIVFKTTHIRGIQERLPPGVESQHYIKRLGGAPGDTLRIAAPHLYLNGALATQLGFVRVMSGENGYRGYSNSQASSYLATPDDTFTVPKNSYFALGDNSYNSFDSRYWGVVPAENMAGRGAFVLWPFSHRWGLIH